MANFSIVLLQAFLWSQNIFSSIHTGFDFGNYSCVAENSIGTFKYAIEFQNCSWEIDFVKLFRKHIEVHGRPTIPIFRSKPNTHQDRVNKIQNWCKHIHDIDRGVRFGIERYGVVVLFIKSILVLSAKIDNESASLVNKAAIFLIVSEPF